MVTFGSVSKVTYRVVIDVYNWLLPLVSINILWFLMSLTIILMPPATAALYEIAYLAKRGHGPEIRTYLVSTRRWALRSWLWGLLNALFYGVALISLRFYSAQTGIVQIGLIICLANVLITLFVQYYFWPYVMLQKQVSFCIAARNALFTFLGDPTLVILCALTSTLLLVTSALLLIPLVVITPVTIAFLAVYSLLDWLEQRGLLESPNQ